MSSLALSFSLMVDELVYEQSFLKVSRILWVLLDIFRLEFEGGGWNVGFLILNMPQK